MKPALLILLALAGNAHAVTNCTDSVKQIAMDIGGNARFYVVFMGGAGFDLPQTGETWRIALALAQTSKMTGRAAHHHVRGGQGELRRRRASHRPRQDLDRRGRAADALVALARLHQGRDSAERRSPSSASDTP